MIDVNTFLVMLMYILGSILIVTLIVLVVKLISTVNRLNGIMDEITVKINKFDKAFQIVDIVTDNMALISDKLVDMLSNFIRKVFNKKIKEEELDEQ